MSAQYTPGPWAVGSNEPDHVFAACDEDGRQFGMPIFAEPFRGYGSLAHQKPSEESIANAHLIAASPELLEALIAALPYVEMAEHDEIYKPGAVRKIVNQMRAAIRKAGEPA